MVPTFGCTARITHVLIGLAAGIGAALLWGVSAALQARAFRELPTTPWTAMVLGAIRSPGVLAVAVMDCGGMALDYVAIQSLPLYLSQACIACAVIVTAATAAVVLHERPPRAQWYALSTLALGLVLLALSAGRAGHQSIGWPLVIGCYVGLAIVAVVGVSAWRLAGTPSAVALGVLAGTAYGAVPVAARAIEEPYVSWLNLAAAGCLAVGGLLGFAFYSTAVTRTTVNTVAAPLTVAETIVPAIVGVLLFNDGIRGGWTSVVVIGLVFSIAGAGAVPLLSGPHEPERVAT